MARLTILLLTYNRLEYAKKTIFSTLEHLKFNGILNIHVADDGSPDGYREDLLDSIREWVAKHKVDIDVTSSNSNRGGYGRNYNLASQVTHHISDYILVLEDDWELTRTLDADKLIEFMQESSVVGCLNLHSLLDTPVRINIGIRMLIDSIIHYL